MLDTVQNWRGLIDCKAQWTLSLDGSRTNAASFVAATGNFHTALLLFLSVCRCKLLLEF